MRKFLLVFIVLMVAFPGLIAASAKSPESPETSKVPLEKLIPTKVAKKVKDNEKEQIEEAVAYGILEAVSSITADSDSPWVSDFENGEFQLKKVVPIYNLDEQLSEVLVLFNDGFVIVDPTDGELVQISYDVDEDYFDEISALYNINFDHFAADSDGQILDGRFTGKKVSEIKGKYVSKEAKDKVKAKKENKKWGTIPKSQQEEIISSFDPSGANEGSSIYNYITDPNLWLLRYYPNTWSNISNLSVSLLYSYSRSVPEILQSNWGPKENDCAIVSTLEILNYYWSLSSTQQRTAYDAMVNSSYFIKPDDGVYPWNNDALFKVGAGAIGKPQSTSDDPEDWSPQYADIKSYIRNNGPGYLSMDQKPYYDHTLTAIGVKEYKTTFRDQYYYTRTFYDNFIRVNDHWSATTGATYVKYRDTSSWYFVSIVKN